MSNETLQSLVKQPAYSERFRQVLGDRAPQFVSSLLQIGNALYDVEPRSILAAAMTAAALDLPINPNLGFAWIVPYKTGGIKYGQFQMGSKGWIQLALRTAQYERMNARAVNAEAFAGYDALGEAVINWSAVDETKPVVGYVFLFRMVNGFSKTAYWPKRRVQAHAERYSQSYRSGKQSPWQTHFDEMALKTVVKNELSDWGILSVQWQRAIAADQSVSADIDAPANYIDLPEPPKSTGLETEEREEAAMGLAPQGQTQAPVNLPEQAPTPASAIDPAKVREDLKNIVTAAGFTFENFLEWAVSSNNLDTKVADGVKDWGQVPADLAKVCTIAKVGLLRSLAKIAKPV